MAVNDRGPGDSELWPDGHSCDEVNDQFGDIVEQCVARFGRVTSVLDLGAEVLLRERIAGAHVFRPSFPPSEGRLPYLSGSVEVVVVPGGSDSLLGEARRIASHAVVRVFPGYAGATWDVEWQKDAVAMPSATVVLLAADEMELTLHSLLGLRTEVAGGNQPEVVVVDVGGDDATARMLNLAASRFPWVKPLHLEKRASFVAACNRGAQGATGDVVTFIRPSMVLDPGWLGPTLQVFTTEPTIGVVASRLVGSGPALLEAGGVLFRDGTAGRFGYGLRPDDALVSFVRPVDWCSIPAITTSRSLFEWLGGFDTGAGGAGAAAIAYCTSVWESGRRVVYQPLSERTCLLDEDCIGNTVKTSSKRKRGIIETGRKPKRNDLRPRRPTRWDRDAMVRLLFRDHFVAGRSEP